MCVFCQSTLSTKFYLSISTRSQDIKENLSTKLDYSEKHPVFFMYIMRPGLHDNDCKFYFIAIKFGTKIGHLHILD